MPAPSIPLSADLRAAYEDLRAKIDTAMQNTADPAALQSMIATYQGIDDLLTMDTEYQLHADTAKFTALLGKINDANDGIKMLKAKIAAVAGGFAGAGAVLAAASKVLTLVG
jgi:uncharacterized protein YdcH (DUF465 family)